MKLHLNLSLRRALLAAMTAVCTLGSLASGGMVDARYDLQYYLDFSYNKGMFSAGATNILVKYADGTSVTDATIPIMPNLDCYVQKGSDLGTLGGFSALSGGSLVAPQYVMSAAHCKETDVFFLTENGDTSTKYTSTGYHASGSWGIDWSVQRLNKIVTEVAYTPFATDAFMSSMPVGTWMYRLGHGKYYNTSGEALNTNQNALGGLINLENNLKHLDDTTWQFITHIRQDDTTGDVRPPLEIGALSGDSGSPVFAWDDANNCFVQVGFTSAGTVAMTYGNDIWCRYNAVETQSFIDDCTIVASGFSGENVITWGTQDSSTGAGTLTQVQGDTVVSVEYVGKGSINDVYSQLGLTFSTEDSTNVQTLALQSSVDMGAGALTFDSGSWKITETQASDTFNSAGFVVNKGASVTLELTATSSEEWRKVGEGILTIAGEGNNDVVLRVGGGTTVYNVTRDEEGNITGCTLGNAGETRLDRTGGYAASSVRLEGGVAILVLMQDNQFKSANGSSFSFGNNGGLLNLNGHDLNWSVINQDGSGTGARIGNFTPEGLTTPGLATFTYTGTGIFAGCFMDEGAGDDKAQLAVVYNNTAGGSWKLTGNHSNVGGYTVKGGTMVLEGSLTPHVNTSDANDWTYASLEGSDVTIESGATFRLSHHAVMTGNVSVQDGGTFILNQTVNAASESIQGSLRQDMAALKLTSLVGDVDLYGTGSMIVNTESPVVTTMKGSITHHNTTEPNASYFVKNGSGVFVVDGSLSVVRGTVNAGGLVATDASSVKSSWTRWTIGEQGFMAFGNVDNDDALTYVDSSSSGVLALTHDQTTALALEGNVNHSSLIIGAWGEVNYGSLETTLDTVTDSASSREVWRLGGGTGTLNVLFKLTGDADLYIGNEWSSGTVNLANTSNDFSGLIYLRGLGNMLEYAVDDAGNTGLGSARVSLGYGSAIALQKAEQVDILYDTPEGVLALATNVALDLSSEKLSQVSIGAKGDFTYSSDLKVADTYRFGGAGNLTLDTSLEGADAMCLDGQGSGGSSVTFARENAYSGSIIAGGGLELTETNSQGDIAIHAGHVKALASAESITLQKGATLYTDGQNLTVRNLSLESGAALRNNGATLSQVTLDVSDSQNTSFANGVLNSSSDTSQLNLIKTGKGTLTMATNADWTGTLVINEGTVKGTLSVGSSNFITSGGIGSSDSVIYVEENGTLSIKGATRNGRALGGTEMLQTVSGTGTIEFSTGGSAFFSTQSTSFEGTLKLVDNTRIYLGTLNYNGGNSKTTYKSLDKATVQVTTGSQVRITPSFFVLSTSQLSINTDFIISGNGFAGQTDGSTDMAKLDRLTEGALAIDFNAIVKGNITLADNATISSSSNGLSSSGAKVSTGYGIANYMGGTIRGRILGTTGEETLTIGGNEGMTITADSANTFGDLVLSNGNGNNSDKFALRLNGGQALSQVSTALGMGTVTVESGLILRLGGTGVADQTDVVYTYANNMSAGNNATLQSYNITNRLTGTVSMTGSSLNLATANGGVLELAGGLDGSGTLNLSANSVVILGDEAASASRAAGPQFSGTVVAGAGADLSLASSSVVSSSTTFSGTDSLTLRFGGQDSYTLGGITVNSSGETPSALTLCFDFSQSGVWSSLNSAVSADSTTIALELNMFNEIAKGNYTLISGVNDATGFVLADDMNGRLSLVRDDAGALVLTVDADNRLFWRTDGASSVWNMTDANWYSDKAAGLTAFSSDADVVLGGSGVSDGNSAVARETIYVSEELHVGTLVAKDAAYEISGSGTITADTLAVGEDGDLKLSNTGGNKYTNGVQIDNGKLEVSGNTLTAAVKAVNGSTFTLSNSTAMTGGLTVDNSTAFVSTSSLNGNVSLTGTGALQMSDATLNGMLSLESGTVSLSSAELSGDLSNGSAALQSNALTIHSGSVITNVSLDMGHLTLQDGSLQINGAAAVDKLSIASGKTVTLWNATAAAGADKVLGTVELGNNAILQTNDREAVKAAPSIGTLKLTGAAATLQDVHHSGYVSVDSLSMDANLSSATLNLKKKAASTYAGLFEFGANASEAGNFVGEVVLSSTDSGSKRSAFIIASGSNVLTGATVNLSAASSSDAVLGLGINADNVTVSGLKSASALGTRAKVFSGTVGTETGWGSSDNAPSTVGTAVRTLTVHTASGEDNSFYGEVLGSVNLVIDGEGIQRFLGTSSSFNGSVTVQGGTAVFDSAGSSLLSAASSVTVGSGTLDLSAIDFTDSANAIALANNASFSFAADSTVALCALESDTQYSVFSVGSGSLSGWFTLTSSNFTLDGVKLSDYGRVELTLGLMGSFSYTITDGWDLVWNGGADKSVWNQSDENQLWQTERTDEFTGETVTIDIGYKNNDNVVFTSDADLELEGNIRINNMTVADGVSLKTNGSLTVTGELSVGNNVSWSYSGDTALSFTEAQLKTFAALEVGEGATLTMTAKTTAQNSTSTAFDKVSGAGNVVLNLASDNGVGFNLDNICGDITVATGRLQVNTSRFNEASDIILATSGSQLVFNGQGMELKNDVILKAATTIHGNSNCSGTISGIISGSEKTLTKDGAGVLTLSGVTTLGGLTVKDGTVRVTNAMTLDGSDRLEMNGGTALQLANGASIKRTNNVAAWIRGNFEVLKDATAEFVSVDDVHLNYNNSSGKGSIVLRENSELTMDVVKLNFYTGADITVQKDAELKLTKSNVHISNKGTAEAKITASSVQATSGQLYSVGNDKFEVLNAHVKSVAATNTTLGNKLTNSSVENAGGGLMTVNNAANTISGVYASAGDMAIMQQALGMNLNELVVGDGMTVSAYSGTEKTAAAEANLTVSGRAEFGAGATLNANLTLNSGASLEVAAGGLAMGSSLTLNEGITLGTSTLERVYALSVGESTTLFSGVDGLTLGGTEYSSITTEDSILAMPYFSNLNGNNYVLTYTGTDNGSLNITLMTAAVPEPTTATLSLLALAALAARRRRK